MFEGIVSFVSGKGWYFCENLADHSAVFIHQRQVENQRYLKVQDRVSFSLAPNPAHPEKLMAVNVKYLGHIIAAQYSDKSGVL
jgi:cold shock CspA family protein